MPAYFTTVRYSRDRYDFLVRREPWWTYVQQTVIVHGVFAFLCFAFGHRFCNNRVVMWSLRLSDKHTDEFVIAATEQQVVDFERWRGWRDWDDDDATDDKADTNG